MHAICSSTDHTWDVHTGWNTNTLIHKPPPFGSHLGHTSKLEYIESKFLISCASLHLMFACISCSCGSAGLPSHPPLLPLAPLKLPAGHYRGNMMGIMSIGVYDKQRYV